MINFVVWKWRQEGFREVYTAEHVNVMRAMLARGMRDAPHRVICVTDDVAGVECDVHPLWSDHAGMRNASGGHLPSCYRRLKLFDLATLRAMGINRGERVVSIDLDCVILGDVRSFFSRPERFVGWEVPGHYHPRVFNGSMWMFTAGDMQQLWTEFDPENSPRLAQRAGYMGSDQAYLSWRLARRSDAGGWKFPSIASYVREVYMPRLLLAQTRIVMFHGRRKPWHPEVQKNSSWVGKHWRM